MSFRLKRGTQQAIYIPKGGILTEVNISFKKKANYRLRVYSKGINGMPDKDILTENIISNKKVIKLNLPVPNEGFFIAVENLSNEMSLQCTLKDNCESLIKHLGYYDWEYLPFIIYEKRKVYITPLIQVKIKE